MKLSHVVAVVSCVIAAIISISPTYAFQLKEALRNIDHTQKGTVFAQWGWNRSMYSNSDIHLKGTDYDLTLYKVKAHDRQSPISYYNYLKIDRITIPQTNLKLGYFINDNWAFTLNVDHMKYVMDSYQDVYAKGYINHEGNFMGTYNHNISITPEFLSFEHTDGLNYINAGIERHYQLYQIPSRWVRLDGYWGGGVGILIPKTNAQFLDYLRNDAFHLAGWGGHGSVGLQLTLFKYFSIRWDNRIGYINMPDILLHQKGVNGKAQQDFWWAETMGLLGIHYNINSKKK